MYLIFVIYIHLCVRLSIPPSDRPTVHPCMYFVWILFMYAGHASVYVYYV